MKRFQKVIIIIVLIFSLFGQNMISLADNKAANSPYGDNMLEYIRGYNDNLLLNRKNYGYMNFVEDFQSDWISIYFLEMTDFFIKTGAEPDKRKYMEVLLNIIATYDFDNASAISEQYNLDNLKEFKDYALDITKMEKEAISIVIGNDSTANQLETSIAIAIDGVSVLAENIDNWINAISDLKTIIQNYGKYDRFLRLIEEEGDNELKEAAATLRKGMSEAIEIKLNTYVEISNENFDNYSNFFFDNYFFTILKQTPQYNSDANVKFLVDCGDNVISKYSTLKSSWTLGTMIGKLVGNVAVGGENIINRLLEMMALHDISVILQEKIIELSNKFVEKYGTEEEKKTIDEYVLYSQYLIGCRVRGEYCVYSTVANDAGLLSWFNKKSAEEASAWYENKTQKILNIQDNLLRIFSVSENINIQEKEIDYTVAYKQIINQYSECRYKDYADLEKENINPLISFEGMGQLYYAFYDLNEDIIPELIIACDDTKSIIDIRTIYNNNVIRLFDNQYRLGLKNTCTIGKDNCVYIFEPCGANKAYEYIYGININQENYLTEIKSYELIADNENNMRYYDITDNNNVEISKEQYESRVINNYNNGSKFEWQLIE